MKERKGPIVKSRVSRLLSIHNKNKLMGTTSSILLAMSLVAAPFTQPFTSATIDVSSESKTQTNWSTLLPQGIWNRLEDGKPLPSGWMKKITGLKSAAELKVDAETDADTTAPIVGRVKIDTSVNAAVIAFQTSEKASAEVRYDLSNPTPSSPSASSEMDTRHSVELNNLRADTEYVAEIRARDESGNVSEVVTVRFRTQMAPDTTAPVMSDAHVRANVTSLLIRLSTDEEARIEVRYDTEAITDGSLSITSESGVRHQLKINDLHADTEYQLAIRATDTAGNTSEWQHLTVRTQPASDLTAPEIQFETVFGISSTSARLFWLTNEPSDTQLWLSTSATIDVTTDPTSHKTHMGYFHQVAITDLEPNTTYYYVIASTDASGNQTILTANSFVTAERE